MGMEIFVVKPTVYFGADAMNALQKLAGKRIMVVTDAFLASSGLLNHVLQQLGNGTVTVFDQVTPDPSLELVARGVQQLWECQPETIIAFGGGSPMDCAKGIRWSAGSSAPLWAIPTTAGTGSEMTGFAVLTDTEKGIKSPLVDNTLLPDVAILDPTLLAGVPASVTADTGMDVLAHAVEAYVSVNADPFTDALAEKAFTLAWQNLYGAYRTSGQSPEKEAMLYASCLAGMAFNAAGLGVCHSLAHALGGRIHIPHGRLNAMLLPRVIMFNSAEKEAARRYGKLAKLCGLTPSPRALAGALNRFLTTMNMPKKLTVDEPGAVAITALADRCTATNPRKPTQMELENILRELGR